jgi:hypothetical protein
VVVSGFLYYKNQLVMIYQYSSYMLLFNHAFINQNVFFETRYVLIFRISNGLVLNLARKVSLRCAKDFCFIEMYTVTYTRCKFLIDNFQSHS